MRIRGYGDGEAKFWVRYVRAGLMFWMTKKSQRPQELKPRRIKHRRRLPEMKAKPQS